MRYLILVIGFLLYSGNVTLAQSGSRVDLLQTIQDGDGQGQVQIEADSLLLVNYYKLRIRDRKISGVPGYRIRIYSESGLGAKEEQQRVRASFLSLFPDIDAYYKYEEPYFKVYVGDCRTRSEALKLHDRIKGSFPNSFYLPDYINIQ
ncbi:MAG: SPOR domain-containing protein [Bacteroidota bacterium]